MIKAAVIGLGKIGLMYDVISAEGRPGSHAYAYHLHPEIDMVAGVGVRQAQGDSLAQFVPEASFYMDLNEMLHRHKLDIVSICTPSHVRYDLIRAVLEQSQARIIFCEKPVAKSIEEAEKIKSLMSKYPDRTLIPNLSRRWNAGVAHIRELIAAEKYGRLKKMHLRYTRGIYNSGSHLFDLVRCFAGSIDEVNVLEQVPSGMDREEDWTYSFRFRAGGLRISGFAEAFSDQEDLYIFELDLFFERGKIEVLNFGDLIRYYGVTEHPLMKGMRILRLEQEDHGVLKKSNNMQNAVRHLAEVFKNHAKPVCTLEDGIYPLYVADALIRSHRSGGAAIQVST